MIPDSFWVALAIILLSTLPYFHDIITDSDGIKGWVPNLGIESLLTDANGKVHGFSTYRVLLYTLLIFSFAAIGMAGWYQSARFKHYSKALLVVLISAVYHVLLIVFNLRKTIFDDINLKMILFSALVLVTSYFSIKRYGWSVKKIVTWALVYIMAMLPFYHDFITERGVGLRSWVPVLGIEELLTDSEGYVRGLGSYRVLVYLFSIYLFSHLGWIGWFFSSEGRKYRPFLLVPAALSLYQVILILMSWRETEFNSPSVNLYISIGLSVLLAINFFYNNKTSPEITISQNKRTTIKSKESEN